jgi:hypothetical protein
VLGRDRSLQRVGTGGEALEELDSFVDLVPPPEAAVLGLEQYQLAAGSGARVAARMLEQHQREQARHLGLVRHQPAQHARQSDRLGAQLAPHQGLTRARGVALVEDQVQGGEHGAEPVGQLGVGRYQVGDARVPDLALRPDEPLLHGRLGGEERARDLRRLEAAQGPQRERHSRLRSKRRVAAGEDQPQPLVGNGAVVDLVLLVGRRHQRLELAHLVLEAPCPADAIDRPVAGGGRDPGPRIAGYPPLRPDLQGGHEGVLDRLLGEVEVAEHADERRDRPSRLLAEQAVDGLCPGAYRLASASFEWAVEPAAS